MNYLEFDLDLKIPEDFVPFPIPIHWNSKVQGSSYERNRLSVEFDYYQIKDMNSFDLCDYVTKRLTESLEISSACTNQFIKKPILKFAILIPQKKFDNFIENIRAFKPVYNGPNVIKFFLDDLILLQSRYSEASVV